MIREVAPFEYWESHSSAITGLGGTDRSPDPRYCFHTRYHEVQHGRAQFVLRLVGVRASFGELSMRIHAWKPGSDSNISLVAGGRTLLQNDTDSDITLAVHFAAQKDVLYALYGYLSEDSDVTAQALHIVLDEPDDTDSAFPEPPRSLLAVTSKAEEKRPANALLHYGRLTIAQPVSQSCTLDQIFALGLSARDGDAAVARWSEEICRSALQSYCSIDVGMEALVIGAASDALLQNLKDSGLVVRASDGPPPPRTSHDFYDVLLMPGGYHGSGDVRHRWEAIEDWLARLKIGGLAVLLLRYKPDGDLVSSAAASEHPMLSRNEIGQWALRLVGSSYSVAPLAFAPTSSLFLDGAGLAAYALIVQRL